MTCPHCRESAKFKEYRSKRVVSLLGPVQLQRGYHCRACRRGHVPWKERLRAARRVFNDPDQVERIVGLLEAAGPG
jgi:hypothetical protein